MKFTIFEILTSIQKMGCLKLTYSQNNDTLKVAYSLYRENQKYCTGSYRYGFNGMEKDDEVKGNGNSLDFKNRIYDARLGKFLSTDVVGEAFPFWSPYHFAGNKPIWCIDLDGLQPVVRKANYGGAEYTFKTSIEDPYVFSITSENKGLMKIFNKTTTTTLDFTPTGREGTETGLNSLGLLVGGNCCVIQKTDKDYIKIKQTVHKGIDVTKILLTVLEQNKDVGLVIVGNHDVPVLGTTGDGRTVFDFWSGAGRNKKRYSDQTNEIGFTKDRANTVNADLFDGKANVYSRGEIKAREFPNVYLDPFGAGSRGVNIFFDFSKTKEVKEPEPKTESEGYESYQNARFLD
jgi:RHS repeat-associated protein